MRQPNSVRAFHHSAHFPPEAHKIAQATIKTPASRFPRLQLTLTVANWGFRGVKRVAVARRLLKDVVRNTIREGCTMVRAGASCVHGVDFVKVTRTM